MKQTINWKKVIIFGIIFVVFFGSLAVLRASAAPNVSKAQATEIQMILVHHRYSLEIDGVYGQQTEKAVRNWQKVNGLFVDGIPGPVTMASLRKSNNGPITSSVLPSKGLKPPSMGLSGLAFAPPGLDNCQEMSFYRVQAGLPEVFDRLGYRESRCRNDVTSSTGCCFGYLQNFITSHLSRASAYRDKIVNECQVTGRTDILGNNPLKKQKQMCVTKVVFDISGLSPWD
jgi:peptidoglycan hydrolase-like protein with peptidoglycan-binding domain